MIDGNTQQLEQYLSDVHAIEGEWAIFEASLDHHEVVERILESKPDVVMELLADDPQNEYHLEALIALARCALCEGEELTKADDMFLDAIKECNFFKKMMDEEKEVMFNEWLENDPSY